MLTKTNYILWRECPKNAWLKVHKPDIYYANELSEFEKQIIETGNEVDVLAREIFPAGEFQKSFEKNDFGAITDIFIGSKSNARVYEVKATNDIDKKTHYHDLAFQVNVLEMSGYHIESANLVHLNKEYSREGELDLVKLFVVEDVTEKINEMKEEVLEEMKLALDYITEVKEPVGPCSCMYKGRSSHCSTSSYSNKDIPEYSVHDLARIGLSKRKLTELVDSHIYHISDIPDTFELSDVQKNQVWVHKHGWEIISRENIEEELERLVFPIYFLDYETFPSAVPRFDGFSPYMQIPFQYSLHILQSRGEEPEHMDFLYTDEGDPSQAFYESLASHIGPTGSVVVWHKDFECGRNRELAKRIPESKNFFDDIETRIFDLEDIFKKQHYVHKDFRGSSSIKKILPVLVPSLKYEGLDIGNGGAAADAWNKIVTNQLASAEKTKAINALREYCKLDTYAMYALWKELDKLIS